MGAVTRRDFIFKLIPAAVFTISRPRDVLAETLMRKDITRVPSDAFVQDLLRESLARYSAIRSEAFGDFCIKNGMDCADRMARENYFKARFLHELIKNKGILGNRYVKEEDRDGIIMARREAYPENEDITSRSPERMISDMLSGKPRYIIEGERRYCFGDCDEFEMAYVVLLRAAGMDGKIVMTEPAHVNSLVMIGKERFLVDNSRAVFAAPWNCAHCRDYRTGPDGYTDRKKARAYIEHINRTAVEDPIVNVFPRGASRVRAKIEAFIAKEEKAGPSDLFACREEKG